VNKAVGIEKSKVKPTSLPIDNKPKARPGPGKDERERTNDGRPRRIRQTNRELLYEPRPVLRHTSNADSRDFLREFAF